MRMVPICGEMVYHPEDPQCKSCQYRNDTENDCDYWKYHSDDQESLLTSEMMEANFIKRTKGISNNE